MHRAGWWLGVVGVAMVALAGRADATCLCGDIANCSSASQCVGLTPGLDCSPPNGGTCHIAKGLPNAQYCCCGCSRNAGAAAQCAMKYAPLADALGAVPSNLLKCMLPEIEKPLDKAIGK